MRNIIVEAQVYTIVSKINLKEYLEVRNKVCFFAPALRETDLRNKAKQFEILKDNKG